MTFQPLSNCVLIEQEFEKQEGLIIVPKGKLAQGWVRAIGPGKKNEDGTVIPTELLVGDHVLFGEHSGQKVKHQNKEYLMMREPDVIGVLNG